MTSTESQLSYVGVGGSSCLKPRLVQCDNAGLEDQPVHWVCWAESESGEKNLFREDEGHIYIIISTNYHTVTLSALRIKVKFSSQ